MTVVGASNFTGDIGVTGLISATGTLHGSNLTFGGGDPNGSVTATPGTLWQRLGASGSLLDHELWVKSSGTGNTGWNAVATQDYTGRLFAPIASPTFTTKATSPTFAASTNSALTSTLGTAYVYNDGSNIALRVSGSVYLQNVAGTSPIAFTAGGAALGADGANYVSVLGAAAGSAPTISTAGSDTNIDVNIVPKGTGTLKVNSSGVVLAKSKSGAPTTTDIPAGLAAVYKDTSGGGVKLYYNDAGTLKSVALT
jgi:hypothetical protein